jgi:hypothetical protein
MLVGMPGSVIWPPYNIFNMPLQNLCAFPYRPCQVDFVQSQRVETSMETSELDSVLDFLVTTAKQGYINDNTALGRRTACVKLFAVLEDNQKTVAYVRDNIDVIKTRFQNLNKDVRGGTVDAYANRVLFAVNDYMKWMADRGAWEREAAARGKAPADGERKTKAPKADKQSPPAAAAAVVDPNTRMVAIPIRPDFDVSTVIPRDITISEVRRIAYVLAGYVVNYDPTTAKALQNVLDFKDGNQEMNG